MTYAEIARATGHDVKQVIVAGKVSEKLRTTNAIKRKIFAAEKVYFQL